ncbi:hypothetical protein Pst134EB_026190 [Puccinia striiformis f. sp. tritici]|nr:hypothetical protein Pst134EB_026190 [Puccinia striiformis f. sp. tritici]
MPYANNVETSLFGYKGHQGDLIHLTKPMVCQAFVSIWNDNGLSGISGHSFRVGGASLRFALGTSVQDICPLGRWTSNCYQLYLQEYTSVEKEESLKLLQQLKDCWTPT